DGQTLLAFPEPEDLAVTTQDQLRALIGNERKAERLLAIARAFVEAGPAALADLPTAELEQWLLALPGIGPWSATFVLLRGFGRAGGAAAAGYRRVVRPRATSGRARRLRPRPDPDRPRRDRGPLRRLSRKLGTLPAAE